MARTEIPTYTTNQLITASHANTYWKDNEAAHWPYTTAGDLAVADSATTLARIAAPTVGQVLGYLGGTWGAVSGGGLQDIQIATGNPNYQTFTTSSYEDVTGATVTLTLTTTCTVILFANVVGHVNSTTAGFGFSVLGLIGGVADTNNLPSNGSDNPVINQALPYFYAKKNVSAGSVVCKLQCKEPAPGTDNRIQSFTMFALALQE